MTLSSPQSRILARVKRYPQGIKIDATEERTAKALAKKGLIELDTETWVAREKK